ncbi:hypothetical protein KUV64_22145 [Mameliella alba]|uniref:hypothetical protein n=1 Tax=Mameliella alba TaxID=561184 RepID=UPI001C9742CD|nr:hypothetical protein [Mameliella alba]MBY6121840.1 hypothetical protein [Mameliella alba]
MKIVAAPTFNEKVISLPNRERREVAIAIDRLENSERSELGEFLVPISSKDGVFVFKAGMVRIFLSFGNSDGEEYALLADLALPHVEHSRSVTSGGYHIPFGSDPMKNVAVDPNRNMAIDPRRNMMIDPRRNMIIDPNRNMAIDPRRNMAIDPNRNMMIDPNRNMMIDPRRNSLINPKKNSLIDPNRNSVWDGAFLFSIDCRPTSFFVRADTKVSLQFDLHTNFIGFCALAGENINGFDLNGRWTSFFAKNGREGYNNFDTSGKWIGFATKSILPTTSQAE